MNPLLTLMAFGLFAWVLFSRSKPKSKVVTLEPIDIYGRPPGSSAPSPKPIAVTFSVAVSGFEKIAVDSEDVYKAVSDKARELIPGNGNPTVTTADTDSGFFVTIDYPDVDVIPTVPVLLSRIVAVDKRLKDRIKGLKIANL